MKILCDQCKREFEGQDWMMDTVKEVLCEDCYAEKMNQ
jgi:hypothetical protein